MAIVRKKETSMIFRKVKEIDPDAFMSMASVMGVYGQGFDKIKGWPIPNIVVNIF